MKNAVSKDNEALEPMAGIDASWREIPRNFLDLSIPPTKPLPALTMRSRWVLFSQVSETRFSTTRGVL